MSKLSRRSLVAGAASLPALAAGTAVAIEAEPDPAAARMIGDTSRAACSARAQHIVTLLDDCYIREGWHETFDRERAARFLENVRTFDEHDGDDPRFTEILEWTRDHGQSLDWLFQGDVRGMIAGHARNSAAASQLAAEPDPIFAVIDRHRAATDAFNAFDGPDDEPQNIALEKAYHKARDLLFETVPTTLAGMKAKISYLMSDEWLADGLTSTLALREFLDSIYKSAFIIAAVS
jgi:hypothetical protein